MSVQIDKVVDQKRGCGWRKEGGMYLMGEGSNVPCGKLPQVIERCAACGHGIKFSRGWTWIDLSAVFKAGDCWSNTCDTCVLNKAEGRAGLLWCGEKFYKKPADWIRESQDQGISRRIKSLPDGFEIGKTWVLMAHSKAIKHTCQVCGGAGLKEFTEEECPSCEEGQVYQAGIFHAFKPSRVEYVVKDGDDIAKLERMAKRGIRIVEVERAEEKPPMTAMDNADAQNSESAL